MPTPCLCPKHTLPNCEPSSPTPSLKAAFGHSFWNQALSLPCTLLMRVPSWITLGFSLPLKSPQKCFLHNVSEYIFSPSPGCPKTTEHHCFLVDFMYRNYNYSTVIKHKRPKSYIFPYEFPMLSHSTMSCF